MKWNVIDLLNVKYQTLSLFDVELCTNFINEFWVKLFRHKWLIYETILTKYVTQPITLNNGFLTTEVFLTKKYAFTIFGYKLVRENKRWIKQFL